MALPLSKNFPDFNAAGPFATAQMGQNALTESNLANQIKQIEAQYAPLTVPAKAMSEAAYASAVYPQFMAKLLGNEHILPNIKNPQQVLQNVQNSAQGGMNAFSNPGMFNLPRQSPPLENVLRQIGSKLFGSAQNQQQQQQPMQQVSQPQQQSQSLQGTPYSPAPKIVPGDNTPQPGSDSGYSYDAQGNNVVANPQEVSNAGNGGLQFAQNEANYQGRVAEGKEAGKIRADDVKDLNDAVFNGETKQTTLNDLSDLVASPIFEQIRQVPLLGHHELGYYSKFGNKEQQQAVGKYFTLTGNIIKDSAGDFKGQFRKGEQQLLNGMKANPSDTVDVAKGKIESLSSLNRLLTERSRLTSHIMNQYHVNKLQASEAADKQLNGEKIRQQVHNRLNPKPTEDDINFMAKKYNISPDEVKKRLNQKGIM